MGVDTEAIEGVRRWQSTTDQPGPHLRRVNVIAYRNRSPLDVPWQAGATFLGCQRDMVAAFAIGIGVTAAAASAQAMQYQRVPIEGNKVIVHARGPIIPGDMDRLAAFFQAMPSSDRIIALSLDSPGGNISEGAKFAHFVQETAVTVVVPSGSECASACFLIFAAAPKRLIAPDALIGVHSASSSGHETLNTMAMTTAMARAAAEFGVPAVIVGKMVQTPPGRMAWLTPDDLSLLGVTVMAEQTTPTPTPPPVAALSQAPAAIGSPSIPPQTTPPSPAFQQGLSDRRVWETWVASLSGEFRAGVEYWASQRSLPKPGSCLSPDGESRGDWTNGCLAAQQRLAPSDVRRKSEPEYRLGWNSF